MTTSAGWAEEAVRAHAGAEHLTREEQVLERIARARARKPRIREERITLSHGAGGKATHTLIEAVFLDAFRNPLLEPLEDGATLTSGGLQSQWKASARTPGTPRAPGVCGVLAFHERFQQPARDNAVRLRASGLGPQTSEATDGRLQPRDQGPFRCS